MSERSRLLTIAILGLSGLLGMIGAVACALLGRDVSPGLTAMTGTCIGALGVFLSHPPTSEEKEKGTEEKTNPPASGP